MTDELLNAVPQILKDSLPQPVKETLFDGYRRLQTWNRARKADRKFEPYREFEPAPDCPQHVVLLVVDALRADAVISQNAPFLSSLQGTSAVTASPWTFPSITSILTGQYPHNHGSMRQSDYEDPLGESEDKEIMHLPPKFPLSEPTVSEIFAGAGYSTYGSFGFLMPFLALSGRFETHALYRNRPSEVVLEQFERWFKSHRQNRTFSYVHLSDLHEPVSPPERFVSKHDVDPSIPNIEKWDYTDTVEATEQVARYREHRKRIYHAAVEYVDKQISDFCNILDRIEDDYLLLITGDHGEAFWEEADLDARHFSDSRPAYSVGHGGTPFESVTRVPFIIVNRDIARDQQYTSLVDIAPTLLDLLGVSDMLEADGQSLLAGCPIDRPVLVEGTRYGYEKKAAYGDEYKKIVSKGDDTELGFSLPDEKVIDLPDCVAEHFDGVFPNWPDGEGTRTAVSMSVQEQLNDLGYK